MHTFLSSEWMTAVAAIRAKHADDMPALPVSLRINQVISDVPFGDGTITTCIDTSSGALVFGFGELDDPDTVMMTDYETARTLLVGGDPALIMQALLAGKVKVQGDMMKLIALQAAIGPTGDSDEIAAEIAAVTA
jgi:hypothetical protein